MKSTIRICALALALALFVVACGSDSETSTEPTPTPEDEMSDESMEDMEDMDDDSMEDMDEEAMEDMDMEDMNMGDPDATPATEVPDAEIETATFVLLDTRPEGYDDTEGTAAIARYDDGTTVTIELVGLIPGEEYIAHLHEDPCSEDGGDHYMFDPDGSEMPPNEIHLLFTADSEGGGFMTAENDMVAGPEGQAVVVHPLELLDNKIACAQFPT